MLVVSDTTPLNYLILIEYIEVVPRLYGSVIVPSAVLLELSHLAAPAPVAQWARNVPTWVDVRNPAPTLLNLHRKLGAGERDAIALAKQLQADVLLVDEALGRQEAKRFGLTVTGTLGILKQAHLNGLLNLNEAISRLKSTSFQASAAIFETALANPDR